MSKEPTTTAIVTFSLRIRKAKIIVKTKLNLSIGATREASPI